MSAQRRRRWPNSISQLGQCIVLSGSGISGDKASPAWQSEQTQDNHPILFQSWASVEDCLWVNIETALGECHVFADVAQSIHQTQR